MSPVLLWYSPKTTVHKSFRFPLDQARHHRLDALVRHEDDTLSRDNSPQPGYDPLVKSGDALALYDLGAGGGGETERGKKQRGGCTQFEYSDCAWS